MEKISIIECDIERFKKLHNEWNELLKKSNSDQLFMSWEWMYSWWNMFAINNCMDLKLLLAITNANELVGIAPVYNSVSKSKGILKTRRLEFIGNC